MKNRTMSYWQKRIFVLSWVAYTFSYLGKINLSVAIPLMEDSLSWDKTRLGLIGSIFFWIYAFGQLINGSLGDKFTSRKFVFIGLLSSAVLNILFGFTTSLFFMVVIWAFNGYFQSMLWGPIMKTINHWFPMGQKSKMALYMFSSVVSGFILTWGCLGQISMYTGWKSVFWIPGIVLIVYSLIWYLFVRNNPQEVGLRLEDVELNNDVELNQIENQIEKKDTEMQQTTLWRLIFHKRLYLIALAGIPLGLIREGISLWAPTILFETFHLNMKSTMSAVLLLPLFNFTGVILARLLIVKFHNKETKLVTIFFIGGIFACVLLYLFRNSNIFVYLALLALCSLSLYAASSIITSVIPLKYKMTSSVAGFLDFSIYLGAGLSGIVTGVLSNEIGWSSVMLLWVLAGVAGIICICIAGYTSKRNEMSFLHKSVSISGQENQAL